MCRRAQEGEAATTVLPALPLSGDPVGLAIASAERLQKSAAFTTHASRRWVRKRETGGK